MIKITIASVKVDDSFAEHHPDYKKGDLAFYVIRESGKRLGPYFKNEFRAAEHAWFLIKEYGLTLVEPW